MLIRSFIFLSFQRYFLRDLYFPSVFLSHLFGLSGTCARGDIVLFSRQEIHRGLHLHPPVILRTVALLQTIMVFCLGRSSSLPRGSSIATPETQCANESDLCRERYGAAGPGTSVLPSRTSCVLPVALSKGQCSFLGC